MLSFTGSLLTGVEASAAQNPPVTKTCLQCGAVLPSSVRACHFCDSSFSTVNPYDDSPVLQREEISASKAHPAPLVRNAPGRADAPLVASSSAENPAWRGELTVRMEAYRARKRKHGVTSAQSQLPFEDSSSSGNHSVAAVSEPSPPAADDFAFTIAIGPHQPNRDRSDGRMEIDVSVPPVPRTANLPAPAGELTECYGLYPVASLDERRLAALTDAACLLFAYGGFLALFSSLGGQFTLSKFSAAVYGVTFAIVYLQYFALFTIFGGTTPGMMFRGLQVTSFTGDLPTPRQMLLRSAGYVLSAGTFFLGFFWAWWDEDALAWHDRLSRTYLSVQPTHAEMESSTIAHSHGR